MGSTLFPFAPVKAQEETKISDIDGETQRDSLQTSDKKTIVENAESTENPENPATQENQETPEIIASENESKAEDENENQTIEDSMDGEEVPSEDITTGEDSVNVSPKEESQEAMFSEPNTNEAMPFNLQVTFDGTELTENGSNEIASSWTGNSSKIMTVVVTRNTDVPVDSNKQYVLCMKTSEVFYFNGLPDASKITGAEDVTIVKNTAPIVNKSAGKSGALDGFSEYSGEIRIKLNPTVETITIPDVGINYNVKLVGYNGTEQTVPNPFGVKLISTDSQLPLNQIAEDQETPLHSIKVNSIPVSSSKFGSSTWKSAMSTDYFKNAVLMQPVTLGKDGHVSYYFGTNGVEYQVYQSLKIKINCPYITVNGEKHYLSFDSSDTSLSGNKKENATGYTMANTAEYDTDNHTITYTFQNVYLGGHTPLIYTPDYKWPTDLQGTSVTGEGYVVEGVSFEVIEQKGYLGNASTLQIKFTQDTKYTATFIPEGINVKMASSDASGDDVAKRYLYKDLTREMGNEGALGFFDIHNEGTQDSPLLNIKYEFNTSNTGAEYYVTRVNLPAYGTAGGTDVSYVLSNGTEEKSGVKHYPNNSNFSCDINEFRAACNADKDYYIKSVSYQTCLQQGTKYHLETAHLKRNRINDSGLFFGYLEGDLNTTASAEMTISSVDGSTITADEKTAITSTEVSRVSDEDYIGMQISNVNIGGAASQMISAGNSVTLNVSGLVSAEEYPLPSENKVNGYHVLRDGIFYVCLPEGVSIAGAEQVKVTSNDKEVASEAPGRIGESFTLNGVQAYWWEIPVKGLNAKANRTFQASIQLSTSESMAGVAWNFSQCVGIRANGQRISWGAASSITSVCNTTGDLDKLDNVGIDKLKEYLIENDETKNLGIEILNQNSNVKLNIARAEAKLDVMTSLSAGEGSDSDKSISISDKNTEVTYNVTIACTEQGTAKDFNYYIPIVHTDSTLDTGALVSQREIGLQLAKAVTIKKSSDTSVDGEELPFVIYYTNNPALNSATIRGDSVTWNQNLTEYSDVTAIRIATKQDASVKQNDEYQISVVMKYNDSKNDFNSQAGSVAAWRSFGHYTYTRNGATTTNSYPSGSNSVKVKYVADLTQSPMNLTLDTGAVNNFIDTSNTLQTKFNKTQNLTIKKVTPSNGTQLLNSSDNVEQLTGADANSKFRISFNVNNSDTAMPLPSVGAGWTVEANGGITLQARAYFSKALTDITTERYVDIVIGNEDVDITCRIKLERKVAAASADGSGVALGEQYQVPQVIDTCGISRDSAFTALYVINNFVPGNYNSQLLKWQTSEGRDTAFPNGTTITMMEVDADSQVKSYWYCQPTGSSVDLKAFKRMAGSESYSYDTSTTTGTTLRYLFVVDFGQADANDGDYQIVFDAEGKEGVSDFNPVTLNVTLGNKKGYVLTSSEDTSSLNPAVDVNYTVSEADGNDSYSEGKSLSLVLKSKNSEFPKDARISCGEKEYTYNSKGNIIIPLGTIQSGNAKLTLISQMFPDNEQTYQLDVALYLSNSSHDEAASGGKMVANTVINFTKSETKRPAVKITGTQIADQKGWSSGQNITITTENLDGCTMTVTSYEGIDGNQKITDLVSSVSGMFEMNSGTGTYKPENTSNGKLTLSSTAKPGTYRLVFEVKNSAGESVLTVPYYFIIQE